jgi:NarL family two-component system sensor histidine kinase YdfH
MQPKLASPIKVEQDYRFFFIFMTIIQAGMAVWSMVENHALQKTVPAMVFISLVTIQIILHWNVTAFIQTPTNQTIYIIGQGLLAFVIIDLSNNIGMIFALHMALIGETIGFLGVTRWSALTTVYYLALSMANFSHFSNSNSGNAFFWMVTSIPTVIFVGVYVTLYTRQAEARERAQKLADELETANRQLSDYAARVEDLTITNERERLARDLHDTLSQGLVGLILKLEAVDAHLAHAHVEKAQVIITQTMTEARSTLGDARNAIGNLREPNLEKLEDALRFEISRFTTATGISCDLQTDPTPPLADPVRETIVRTVREGLTNIAHHAQARNVHVIVRMKDNNPWVTIQDDGQGFDADSIPAGHYGLLGIRERVRLVNGTFDIQSSKGNGTTLKIQIPL